MNGLRVESNEGFPSRPQEPNGSPERTQAPRGDFLEFLDILPVNPVQGLTEAYRGLQRFTTLGMS